MADKLSGNRPIDSFAPVVVDQKLTIEDEAAFMNRGRGKSITYIVAAIVAAVVGVVLMLRTMDADRAYTDTGGAVRALAAQHFDAYWNCAVPVGQRVPLSSGEELAIQMQRVAERFGSSYAATLQRCQPQLELLISRLGALEVPEGLEPARGKLTAASETVLTRAKALQQRFAALETYRPESAVAEIGGVAEAWDGFDTARTELLRTIDER